MGGIDYGAEAEEAPDTLLRWGSPGDLAPLPQSGAEVRELGELFRRRASPDLRACEIVTGPTATKRALAERARGKRYLHLATHAWFVDADLSLSQLGALDLAFGARGAGRAVSPMVMCGLALAGANRIGDHGRAAGIMTAEEICNLPLAGCELAVLSACQTALGHRRPGQALASLQKALRIAGARWTLSSLWRVRDDAARVFMAEFYQHVFRGEALHEAVWQAKLAMRKQRRADGQPQFGVRDWAVWRLDGPALQPTR